MTAFLPPHPRVLVVGGGIAGLGAAFTLSRNGLAPIVIDAGAAPGGVIQSRRDAGFLVEAGPNTIQATTPLLEQILEDLGLAEQRAWASDAARHRYVVRGGAPVPLPTSPPGLLSSSLFSTRAKLRLLREPFVRAAPDYVEESVAAFARRRLGEEILAYAVNPFVAGIYAGNPEKLSLREAFPRLHALEQQHGSLIGAQIKHARSEAGAPERRRSFSFRDGLQTLPLTLAEAIEAPLELGTTVQAIHPDDAGWRVTAGDRAFTADAVVLALPLHRLRSVDLRVEGDLSPLERVSYPPVSSIALGFRRADVRHPLDGFGVLVPAAEAAFRILGTLFSSTLFPNRAPDGHVLLTTLVGGARRPDLALAPESDREQAVVEDLRRLLGVQGEPVFVHHHQWRHAIPQYELGYARVRRTLAAVEAAHPTLAFAGNYRSGISVGDALASGVTAAERLLVQLERAAS